MVEIVFPDDPMLRGMFGGAQQDTAGECGCKRTKDGRRVADAKRCRACLSRRKAERCYLARLNRAEERGVLPRRLYTSPRRYGWLRSEVEAALERLPRSYSGFASAGHSTHAA
jgi:hypothetical protein